MRQFATPNYQVRGLDVTPDGRHLAVRVGNHKRSSIAVWELHKKLVKGVDTDDDAKIDEGESQSLQPARELELMLGGEIRRTGFQPVVSSICPC